MPRFRRIKIQATVETAAMLLPEEQIEHTVGTLRERLQRLHLSIVSVEPIEPAATPASEPCDRAGLDESATSRLRQAS